MKRRINFQYMMLAFIAIFTTVVMSTVVFYNMLKSEVKDELITCSEIIMQSSDIKNYVSSENKNLSSINFTSNNLRITIIDENGNAIFDSDVNAEALENHNERPEVLQAHNSGSGYSVRTSQTLGKSAFYYAVLLDNNNVLRVSKETSSMTGIIIHALPLLFVLCIILFIIFNTFSHMLTKSIVKPIEYLAQNLDNTASAQPEVYKELIPFVTTIQKQHTDIKRNANLRQEFTANVSH
ncbi:MAG: two-component sensor histidine kinase, partial [Lachnospira sp.]|nr:two-component sensor histidine kinase [Lachnospira sp.]